MRANEQKVLTRKTRRTAEDTEPLRGRRPRKHAEAPHHMRAPRDVDSSFTLLIISTSIPNYEIAKGKHIA